MSISRQDMARALRLHKAVGHLQNIEDKVRELRQEFNNEFILLAGQYPEIVEELKEEVIS